MGGNLKADMPSPEDMSHMFEDAAYWNRYSQFTPWGNVVWNDDRTAMYQDVPPWMLDTMGAQVGLQQAALGELLSWFGGSALDFTGGEGGDGGDGPYGERPWWVPPGYWSDDEGVPDEDPHGPDQEESLPDSKSYVTDSGVDWGSFYQDWGIPQVPDWFKETRWGDDPEAFAYWFLTNEDRGGMNLPFDMNNLPENWQDRMPRTRRSGGTHTPEEGGGDDTWPYGWINWPSGTGETGDIWGGYGGREPEMFWAQDIPSLLWDIDWDAVPDLPTLDQFSDTRSEITDAMFNQGMGLLAPYMEQQESRARQGLADRGIPIAAEIGMAEMGDWGRERSKLLSDMTFASLMGGYDESARQFGLGLQSYGAGLQGELARLGAANQARGQAWNERMGVRSQKFNELASILGLSPSQGGGQQPYNFNPNIDVMGGYGIGAGMNQFNSGLFNQWLNNIFNSISFV